MTASISRKHGAMNGSSNTKRFGSLKRQLGALASAALIASGLAMAASSSPAGAATTINICAKGGSATIADPNDNGSSNLAGIPFIGLKETAACGGATVNLGDPTPIRLVSGQDYDLVLDNDSGEELNLAAAGLTGPNLDGVMPGGTGTYSFTAGTPGTYLLESTLDPRHTLMGVHAVVIVDPVPGATSAHGTTGSEYDSEEVVLLHEVDIDFMNNPGGFNLEQFKPDLHLVNGKIHTLNTEVGPINVDSGDSVLVRYVNAASSNSVMAIDGLRQAVMAFDGEIQDETPGDAGEVAHDWSNVFLTAGQTADVILTIGGAPDEEYVMYNRNLRTSAIQNNGGQIVRIVVGAGGIDPGSTLYMSLNGNNRVFGAVSTMDEDVISWDGVDVNMVFDGSDHGLSGTDLNAVDVDTVTGDVYFSLRDDFNLPAVLNPPLDTEWAALGGAGALIQEQDVIKWDGSVFTVWFDGSFAGLGDGNNWHNINGVDVDPATGITYLSTNGPITSGAAVLQYPGTLNPQLFGANNEDIFAWVPDTLGGLGYHWERVFDGTDFYTAGGWAARPNSSNVNGVEIVGNDVLWSEANTNAVQNIFFQAPAPASPDNDDLFGCLGHAQAAPGSMTDTCTSGPVRILDADTLPMTSAHGNIGQVDGWSLG